ncbi:MAG: sirohydrochlorin ferrochelatase [Candidatus Petromonas sp.]|jgi:sirohydrochlorin cobaltochelatase|nr:sirohydrochlorin ferrochelatase [Candidatus Petromonas sp.]
MGKAILIIGHGSRSKEAQTIFNKIVDHVRNKSEFKLVEGAHMELCEPSIPETVDKLVEKGANEVIFVPYFLYEGIHIKEDIPDIVNELSQKYNEVQFKMAKPIGAEPVLAEILLTRAKQAI